MMYIPLKKSTFDIASKDEKKKVREQVCMVSLKNILIDILIVKLVYVLCSVKQICMFHYIQRATW